MRRATFCSAIFADVIKSIRTVFQFMVVYFKIISCVIIISIMITKKHKIFIINSPFINLLIF